MKVTHIRLAFGGILSSVIMGAGFASSASAVVTHETHSDVQFTFNPIIVLTLTNPSGNCVNPPYVPPAAGPTFCIEGLAPGNNALSNIVNADVKTNSATGYTLYATVGGTGLDGTSTFTNDKLSLVGATTPSTSDSFEMISSGTSLTAGKWGVTLDGSETTPTFGALALYSAATPTTLNKTVDSAGTAGSGCDIIACPGDTSHNGTNVQIGAYADTTQIAGSYQNVINFTALTNVQTRTITLNRHDTNVASYNIVSVDGTPITPTTSGTYGEGQVLGIEAVCTNGYNFWGWGLSHDFGRLANQDSATTTYTVGGDGVTITAYCGVLTMQNFTAADAASMATGDTDTRQDERDGNFYTIAKLPDGKVWMTKNLDLPGGTILTSSTSNLNGDLTSYTLPASETITSGTTLANSSAFSDDNTAYVFNSGSTTCSSSSPCYSYYSFVAATAGTGDSSLTAGEAPSDICPKGWRLPTQAEYTTLKNTYTTGATLTAAPFNGVYAGGYDRGSFYDGGSFGTYWSSTAYNASDACRLYFGNSGAGVGGDDNRYGYSVRCVANS